MHVHLEERRLSPGELVVCKVVGNETDLTQYSNKVSARFESGARKSDWTAMYMQFKRSHALGTVPYRWDDADASGNQYMVASLVEVRFTEPLDVIAVAGQVFWDPSTDGVVKAQLVKERLGIPSNELLMSFLGQQGKALLMQETEDEWELILNHDHLASLQHEDRIVASFGRASTMPVTLRWTSTADGVQRRYESDDRCLEEMAELCEDRNEEPAWLLALPDHLTSNSEQYLGKTMELAISMALGESAVSRKPLEQKFN